MGNSSINIGTISLKIGGLLLILVGFVIIFIPSGTNIMYNLSMIVIILGIIGLVKDEPKGKAIKGFLVGIFSLIVSVVLTGALRIVLS